MSPISLSLIMYRSLAIIILAHRRASSFPRSKILFWDKSKENVTESTLFAILVLMPEFIKRKISLSDNLISILFSFLKFSVSSCSICNIILSTNYGTPTTCTDWASASSLISIFCGLASCCIMWEHFLDVSGVDLTPICSTNCSMQPSTSFCQFITSL